MEKRTKSGRAGSCCVGRGTRSPPLSPAAEQTAHLRANMEDSASNSQSCWDKIQPTGNQKHQYQNDWSPVISADSQKECFKKGKTVRKVVLESALFGIFTVFPSLLRTNCVKMMLFRLKAPLTSSLRRGING